jgi:hypothetical protein
MDEITGLIGYDEVARLEEAFMLDEDLRQRYGDGRVEARLHSQCSVRGVRFALTTMPSRTAVQLLWLRCHRPD